MEAPSDRALNPSAKFPSLVLGEEGPYPIPNIPSFKLAGANLQYASPSGMKPSSADDLGIGNLSCSLQGESAWKLAEGGRIVIALWRKYSGGQRQPPIVTCQREFRPHKTPTGLTPQATPSASPAPSSRFCPEPAMLWITSSGVRVSIFTTAFGFTAFSRDERGEQGGDAVALTC